ncbi:hypothetical protein AZI86_05580 [Bdellovibrio bacteriovorus]|uniref:Sensory/regulatory protein RpfC n=1 Tax=Bdellovibrio bacteriovorus TaxID=959 RepID=A0A150WQD1_BDEBC|nr:ATP-binding protein [Bdellovibrio bacteriovorus]KYG66517.1 hypothetical protein AZI86_05580 [Bdellovibrio bacteriovorus]
MKQTPPFHEQETARLAELRRYKILDTDPEELYTNIANLASQICETPICAVSFVDKDRQWFKSSVGLEVQEIHRETAFCAYTILQDDLLEVEDATKDERFAENQLVTDDPNIRFYAGVPLLSSKGLALGALCVIDNKPRSLTPYQKESLKLLAKQVMLLNEQRILHERSRLKLFQKKSVISNMTSGVMAVDMNGDVMFTNQAFVDLFNLDIEPQSLEGRHYAKLIAHYGKSRLPDVDKLIARVTEIINKNEPIYGDKIRTLEGLIIERDFVPVNFEGQTVGHLWVYRDVTLKIKQERMMAQSLKKAEELTALKSQFLANMSHEIRTPLNGIIGMSGLLLDLSLDKKQTELTHNIRECGESLLEIVNDILDYSKIEANKFELVSEPFNIESCIDQSLYILDHRASQKGLTLTHRAITPLPKVVIGDMGRLKQILVNLIGNAVKFTHQGQVQVKVGAEDLPNNETLLSFSVQDTGVGIPPDRMDRLFKSFSQVDSSTSRHYGGTGLGLAISKNLCELMGGSIKVQSEVGVGTTFSFTVKLKCEADESLIKKKDVSVLTFSPEAASNLTILVVDDNAINRLLAVGLLQKMGFSADTATNGIEAIEAVNKKAYDIVLMDVQMPEMSGLEATDNIRKMKLENQPAIIALTANAMREDEEKCLAAGMNDYLSKPIQPKLLAAKIQKVIDQKNF